MEQTECSEMFFLCLMYFDGLRMTTYLVETCSRTSVQLCRLFLITFVCAIIIIIIIPRRNRIYSPEDSQAVPARPSGKGRLETKLTRWEVKKVAWREVDCWESGTGGRGWAFGLSLEIWGRHYSEILITLGGLCAGGNFEVNCGKGCNRSAHCNFKIRI